jgi:long-chain fatty acid transport protein
MPLELTRQMKSMWGRVFVVMLGIAILTVSSSHAAGFATPGVGIRARSMGGAFRGLANDWSAASHNPAGLAFLKSSELNISLGTYTPGLAYTPNLKANGFDLGFKDGQKRYPLDELFPIPSFAGIAVPSQTAGWVLGAAIFWPYDANYSWDLFNTPFGYNNNYQFAKRNFRTDLDVLDIHPVVARKFGENLSVGAGLSLTNGDLVYRRVLFIDNPLEAPFNQYPYDRFLADFQLDGKGFTVGGNAGLFWRISENLSLGVSAQAPVTVPLKGDAQLNMAWPLNTALQGSVVVVGEDTLRSDVFFSGNYRVGQSAESQDQRRFELDLHLPAQFGAGVGWTASDRLTLAFDAVVTFWSAVDSWTIALADSGLITRVGYLTEVDIPFGWKNQLRISGGAEFAATENVVLRCGLYYDGTAAPDSTFGPSFPDVGDKIGVTFGGAYTINGHLELGAAQELGFYSTRNVGSTGTGVGQSVYPGEYRSLRSETLLSMSYRF